MTDLRWDEDPTVAWVRSESDPDNWYRVTNILSLYPQCNCTAGKNGIDCKHVVAVMAEMGRDMTNLENETQTTRAVAPRQLSMRDRAQMQRETLAQMRGGFEDAKFLAEQAKELWPDELRKNPKQEEALRTAALIVQQAIELGVSATQAFSYIAVIKGKPFLMARMVNALVNARGAGYITYPKMTPTAVTATAVRPGRPEITVTITMEMAQKAGWTSNALYKSNPMAMLKARATTTVGWMQFPDILAGMDAVEVGEGGAYEVITVAEAEEATPGVAVEHTEQAEAGGGEDEELPPIEGESRDLPDEPEVFGASRIPWEELKNRMSVRLGELGLDWPDLKRVEGWPADAKTYQEGITRWAREHGDTAVENTLPTLAFAAKQQAQSEQAAQPSMLDE